MASRSPRAAAALLAPSLLLETARLNAELTGVIERSRDLRWWAQQLRARSISARRLPICGGASVDDAGQVLAMITRVSLCPVCIGHKTGIPVSRVEGLLTTIAETIALTVATQACASCRSTKVTYSFDGAAAPRGTTPGRGTNGMQRTILNLLGQHQGTAFCVDCIAAKLFAGKDLDGPMRLLEGYGVRRYHDRCSACGKQRLVASLPGAN